MTYKGHSSLYLTEDLRQPCKTKCRRSIIIIIIIIIIMSVFLECLSMWNKLNCAEQVQIQKYKTHPTFDQLSCHQSYLWVLDRYPDCFSHLANFHHSSVKDDVIITHHGWTACIHEHVLVSIKALIRLYTVTDCLVGPVVKASASRVEDPGFESHLRWDFSRVESYQWLQNWHSSGNPARRLVL